jgi:hypothetical protein
MLLRVMVLATAVGVFAKDPAPPATRYKVDQRIESRIDLSAFGQGEQVQNGASVWYLSISYADTTGGTTMHAILDSVQLDLGMATPPQATVDSAKGTAFHALLGPTGRVVSLSVDKPGLLASQAEGLLKTFHPRVKRGARPGEAWADTIEVDSHSAQANTRTNTVTSFTMGGAEAWGGEPATRLDATFTGTVTGTLITPAGSADMDGKNTGTAVMYLGRDGRYLGGTSTTAGDASVSGGFAPAPIPIKTTTKTTVSVIK